MNRFSIDTARELTPSVMKHLGFGEFMQTLNTLNSVFDILDLTKCYGKPGSSAALAFHLGVEYGKMEKEDK